MPAFSTSLFNSVPTNSQLGHIVMLTSFSDVPMLQGDRFRIIDPDDLQEVPYPGALYLSSVMLKSTRQWAYKFFNKSCPAGNGFVLGNPVTGPQVLVNDLDFFCMTKRAIHFLVGVAPHLPRLDTLPDPFDEMVRLSEALNLDKWGKELLKLNVAARRTALMYNISKGDKVFNRFVYILVNYDPEEIDRCLSTDVYISVARVFNTTERAVEKSIREIVQRKVSFHAPNLP